MSRRRPHRGGSHDARGDPYLVLLTGLLSFEEVEADTSTLVRVLAIGAALMTAGVVTFAIWWRLTAPDDR